MIPVFSPNIVQRRLLRIPAPQAAQVLQGMANQDAQTLAVQLQAIMLWAPSQMQRLRKIWQWLPTHYEREMDGDNWQYTADTLQFGGDCEDWSVALCSHLRAASIDARIGIMPDHAAVFVPLGVGSKYVIKEGFQIRLNPELIPDTWRTMTYEGRIWLPLESTLKPDERGFPGEGTADIRGWVRKGQLWIAAA